MKFIDRTPWSNEVVYQQEFFYKEFAEKGRKVEAVSHIFVSILMLIRIFDLVKYKWIKKKEG